VSARFRDQSRAEVALLVRPQLLGISRRSEFTAHQRGALKLENGLRFWGVYKLLLGLLAGTESLLGMLHGVNGPVVNIWGPLTVAAAVLLAIEGVGRLFSRANRWVLVVLAALIPMCISMLSGEWPPDSWVFAVAIGFIAWVFQELEHATGRTEIGAMACSIALATSLANTTFMLFRLYWDAPQFWGLGQIFRFMLPIALPWTLVLVLLIHTTGEVIWGTERNVNRGPQGNAQGGPYRAA
jgi:hypothetical protein